MPTFDAIDYAVISAYLIGIFAMGAYFASRQKSLKDYFHAGSTMPWWAVGVSSLATGLSPISYLAGPGWIFLKDSRNSIVMTLLGVAFVPLIAVIWLPLWSRLRVLSIYEYLGARFHPSVRSVGALLFLLTTTLWVGTALGTAGMAFTQVSGFDARLCIVTIAVLGTAYTALGGMRAVIWTDVAQFFVFIVGYGAILVTLLQLYDWQPLEIYRIASTTISPETGYPHTQLISFELDPNIEATFWVLIFIRLMTALGFGSQQFEIQRLHATKSRREMFKALIGSYGWLLLFMVVYVPASWGFVAFYAQHADLKASITHADQVLPDFVVRQLPHLFRSLIMAGVLAALMSSFDSAINSMCCVTVNDFYRRYFSRGASEKQLVLVAKGLTVGFGAIVMLFALWQINIQDGTALEKIGKLTNVVAAPVVSFFLLGVLSKRTNTPGVLIGALAGVAFAVVFNGIPGIVEKQLDWINWMWVGGLATIVNLIVGYAASWFFPPPSTEAIEKLYAAHTRETAGPEGS